MHEAEQDSTDTQRFPPLWAKLRQSRTLLLALVLSVGAHALFVVVMNLATLFNLPFAIDFTPSSGVGMMSRIGRFYEGKEITSAPRYTNISIELPPSAPTLGPAPPDPADADSQASTETPETGAEAPDEPVDSADDAPQDGDDAAAGAQAQAATDAQAALDRAARRKRRRDAERLRQQQAEAQERADAKERADAEARALDGQNAQAPPSEKEPTNPTDAASDTNADATGEANAGPNLDLPPGERYPAGTINPIATDLGMWGPEGARVVVVMRNDRLRRSPHVESARTLMQSFPDWRTLVGGATLDPINDIDTLIISSADPNYINQTFMAAVHHVPSDRVIDTLSGGNHGGVTWEEDNGRLIGRPARRPNDAPDPRVFYVPSEQIFVYTRPEFMAGLRGDAPPARNMEGALERVRQANAPAAALGDEAPNAQSPNAPAATAGGDAAGATGGTPPAQDAENAAPTRRAPRAIRPDKEPPLRDAGWIAGLMQVADYGGTERDGPAIMVSTGTIDELRIQGYRGKMPRSLHANVYAEADVRITLRALFDDKAQAEAFVRAWPDIVDANRSALTLVGLVRAFSEASLAVDHNESIITLTVPQATMRRLAVTVSQLMETR